MRYFTLNLAERDKKLFSFVENDKDLTDILSDYTGNKLYHMRKKKPGTCFDEAIIPWDEIKIGDVLWLEVCFSDKFNMAVGWHEVVVTMKYGGVVFYRFVEKTENGIFHFELNSLMADTMVYPYKIVLPSGWKLADCPNPKQVIEYVD